MKHGQLREYSSLCIYIAVCHTVQSHSLTLRHCTLYSILTGYCFISLFYQRAYRYAYLLLTVYHFPFGKIFLPTLFVIFQYTNSLWTTLNTSITYFLKRWAHLGFKPRTTHTLREKHTLKPTSLLRETHPIVTLLPSPSPHQPVS